MNYDEMPAGREMDALVAEKVMADPPGQVWPRAYSTDIATAWEVAEKMRQIHAQVSLIGTPPVGKYEGWSMIVWKEKPNLETPFSVKISLKAPLAICRAALKAVDTCDP